MTSFSTSLQEVSKGHNDTDAVTTSQGNIAPLDGYVPDVILDAVNVVLNGIEPGSQKDIDDRLSSVEVANSGEMFAVSSICARAAASLKCIPTIRHLARIYHKKVHVVVAVPSTSSVHYIFHTTLILTSVCGCVWCMVCVLLLLLLLLLLCVCMCVSLYWWNSVSCRMRNSVFLI